MHHYYVSTKPTSNTAMQKRRKLQNYMNRVTRICPQSLPVRIYNSEDIVYTVILFTGCRRTISTDSKVRLRLSRRLDVAA